MRDLWFFLFGAALGITIVAALTPTQAHPLQLFAWEKGDHLIAFAVLTGLGALAFPRLRLIILGVLLVSFGGIVEALQSLPVFGRDPSFRDIIIDAVSVAIVLAPMGLIRRLYTSRKPISVTGKI